MKLNFMSTRFLRILVAAGYLLMCLLAGDEDTYLIH